MKFLQIARDQIKRLMIGASVVPMQQAWSIQELRRKENANAKVLLGVQFVQKQNPDQSLLFQRSPVFLCHAKLIQIANRAAVNLRIKVLN